jgi:hypothetical protein
MAMDPGQRGFGQQQRYNIPDLPFKDLGRQGPAGAGNVPYFDRIKRLLPGGQIPPELLELLMAQFFGGQGGGAPQRPPMGGGRPPMGRPPMGGPQRGGQRPPMGGGRPPMGRPPMGGGRPPVVKIEDLVRALSGGGGQRPAPQANMPVPQARR